MYVVNISENVIVNYIDYNDTNFPNKHMRSHIRTIPIAVTDNINDAVIALEKAEKKHYKEFLVRNNNDASKISGCKFGDSTGDDEESFCMFDNSYEISGIVQEVINDEN